MGLFAAAPEQCYFCGSAAGPTTRPPRAWTCPACGCWNGRDRDGRIDGDHPAMRDSAMNEASYSKRARPSSSRLPSTATSPFCHTCQANQTLVVNLLGTYLPDESDPAYADRLASLDAYRASLYERYPPVCAVCQPAVEAGLKRADQRAQAEAWGSALKRGVVMDKDTDKKEGRRRRAVGRAEAAVWRARCVAWSADVVCALGAGVCAWAAPEALRRVVQEHAAGALGLRAAAILWAVWDPTWLRRARAGREPLNGRRLWVGLMLALYVLRLSVCVGIIFTCVPMTWVTAAAVLDISLVMVALTQRRETTPIQLTLVRPVPVEPISRPSSQARTLPPTHPSSTYAPASAAPPAPPVFGQTSLNLPERDEEPMDWEPTSPGGHDWDGFGVGQQRMFASSESNETGLEALIATWGLGGSSTSTSGSNTRWGRKWGANTNPNMVNPNAVGNARSNGAANRANGDTTHGMFSVPARPPAPQPPNVLGMLRAARGALLALRVLALAAALASRVGQVAIHAHTSPLLDALLGLEAAASTVTLGAVLVLSQTGIEGRREGVMRRSVAGWCLAALLAADATVRAAALLAPQRGSVAPHAVLAYATPEIGCAAWAAADLVVLMAA